MKTLKIALAAIMLASPAALFADPAVVKQQTVHTERTVTTNGGAMHAGPMKPMKPINMHMQNMRPGEVRRTTVTRVTHRGWTQGKHKGWKTRCAYSTRNGHRVHTCRKTHM